MARTCLAFAIFTVSMLSTNADQPVVIENHAACSSCDQQSAWATVHGWLFRRYAGSVEMETKGEYPKNYFGRYTFRPWRPDWVKTPSNLAKFSHQPRQHVYVPDQLESSEMSEEFTVETIRETPPSRLDTVEVERIPSASRSSTATFGDAVR